MSLYMCPVHKMYNTKWTIIYTTEREVIMVCQCRFIRNIDTARDYAYVGQHAYRKSLYLPLKFAVNLHCFKKIKPEVAKPLECVRHISVSFISKESPQGSGQLLVKVMECLSTKHLQAWAAMKPKAQLEKVIAFVD